MFTQFPNEIIIHIAVILSKQGCILTLARSRLLSRHHDRLITPVLYEILYFTRFACIGKSEESSLTDDKMNKCISTIKHNASLRLMVKQVVFEIYTPLKVCRKPLETFPRLPFLQRVEFLSGESPSEVTKNNDTFTSLHLKGRFYDLDRILGSLNIERRRKIGNRVSHPLKQIHWEGEIGNPSNQSIQSFMKDLYTLDVSTLRIIMTSALEPTSNGWQILNFPQTIVTSIYVSDLDSLHNLESNKLSSIERLRIKNAVSSMDLMDMIKTTPGLKVLDLHGGFKDSTNDPSLEIIHSLKCLYWFTIGRYVEIKEDFILYIRNILDSLTGASYNNITIEHLLETYEIDKMEAILDIGHMNKIHARSWPYEKAKAIIQESKNQLNVQNNAVKTVTYEN